MLLAVAEVMFQMVALGLEGVVVFVLDLPAGAAGSRQDRHVVLGDGPVGNPGIEVDRKSTRLNSSHLGISYAVFCLKKKKKNTLTKTHLVHSYGSNTRRVVVAMS